jgi:hypothetical protein
VSKGIYCRNVYSRRPDLERVDERHGGKARRLSEAEAIAGTKQGRWRSFTWVNGRSVWVIVAAHNGREYLKIEADGYEPTKARPREVYKSRRSEKDIVGKRSRGRGGLRSANFL